jgi:hypothetical protein
MQEIKDMDLRKQIDWWSYSVIAATLVLFLVALYTHGLTRDLLLEAGVFLVSVKLILVGHKMSAANDAIQEKLAEIHLALQAKSPIQAIGPITLPRTHDGPPAGM